SCPEKLGDTIKIGRRGSLSFVITVDGKQAHAAYPAKGDNPIPKLARFIDRISQVELDKGNNAFDPSTLAVTSFDVGNPATNVIPARAVAKFNIRYSTEHTPETLKTLIQKHAEAVKAELGGKWTVVAYEGADAFITEPGAFVGLVQDAVEDVTGLVPKLSTSGGTSDARFVKDYCPVLEFGPTNTTIHQTDEHIGVEELKTTTSIYLRVIERYFGAEW
ncbi:MAG: M20/M25/M40 family metallo-hydrolase, partial [Aestuariivirga sp.]